MNRIRCGIFLACLPLAATATEPSRPNVLVILADDLGFSDLGCYGGEIDTPNLDRLAAGGLRFTQGYNTARCWPTRAALLTGYYPQAVRRDALPGGQGGVRATRPGWAKLLPARLAAAGYRSYHSGKWHIDGDPREEGFARSLDVLGVGQSNYFDPAGVTVEGRPLPADTADFYATTAIGDHAVTCLAEHARDHAGEPFFHYVAFTAPHFPLQAPPEAIARYRQRYLAGWEAVRAARAERLASLGIVGSPPSAVERDLGPPYAFPEALERLGAGEVNRPHPWDDLTAEQREFQATKMAIHAAMVDVMDREVGRIIAQLEAMAAFDNTLVVFLSDNGGSAEIMVRGEGHDPAALPGSRKSYLCLGPGWSTAANTPFRRHKTWTHEGGIATPWIVHWPEGIAAKGELRLQPVHAIDVVPTVLELARVPEEEAQSAPPLQGRSFAGALAAAAAAPAHESLWWCHEGHRAVRVGDWKLVAAKGDPWELYDLASDRCETDNLAAANPDRVAALDREWNRIAEECRGLASTEKAPPKQPEVAPAKAADAGRPPNVVIVFADDMGYGDLGCYGGTAAATPAIDSLARAGIRFTDFHVAQAVCSASRAALLTGCYPNRIGISGALSPAARHGLADEETTLAELLRARGYRTAAVGKWHLGHHAAFLPTRHGFDEYFGLPYSNDMWPHHPGAKPGTFPPLPLFDGEEIIDADVSPDDQATLTARYADRAVDFLERAGTAADGRPFFLYLAHSMPHVPLFAGEAFRGSSPGGLYGDVLAEIDASVAAVLTALDRTGHAEDTLVIVTSDNGPWLSYGNHGGSAGPLREGKGTSFEGGVRVPCVARLPGLIQPGTVCDSPAMTIDLLPTIAAVAGEPLPSDAAGRVTVAGRRIDGRNIEPLLRGEPDPVSEPRYHFWYADNQLQAVREGNWKLFFPHTSRTMAGQSPGSDGIPGKYRPLEVNLSLYDLAADPSESRDVAAEHPDVVARLEAQAERARADLGDSLTRRQGSGGRAAGRVHEATAAEAKPAKPAKPAGSTPAVGRRLQPPAEPPPAPTCGDVPYGEHPKQVLHFWKAAGATAESPAPLVFFIHGGGWQNGDRMSGLAGMLPRLLEAGISVVSIEYRFISEAMEQGIEPPVKAPLHDAARALQFVRSKAREWHIDKTRVAAAGGSAGACSSLWLAFRDDLADPTSADPVARESTRLLSAAVTGAQTTLDPKQMKDWTPNSRYGGHAFGFMKSPEQRDSQFEQFLRGREQILPWIKAYSPYALVSADDPPVYLFYRSPPNLGQPEKDPTHTANFGVKLAERLAEVGVGCELVYPGAANVKHASVEDYLIAVLGPAAPAAVAPAVAAQPAAAGTRPPNIVFFLCDDLGVGDVGALGSKDIQTPNIDTLFARGTRLSWHWAGNAVCAPSRCVLMTGKHPGHAAVRSNREVKPEGQFPMPAGTVTLATILRDAGYATGGFGKWGLGAPGSVSDPVACGFDRFYGYNCQRAAHTFYPGHLWDTSDKVLLDNPALSGDPQVARGGTVPPEAAGADAAFATFTGRQYSADLIAAEQLAFIREHAARPFFLYVPTTVPHLALQVPADEPSLVHYEKHFGEEEPYLGGRGYVPCRRPLSTYAAMITRMDREVGRIVTLLEELGLTEDTIFVFSSDNGATRPGVGGIDTRRLASNGPFRDWKGSPYEGGLRVPTAIAWPGKIPAGKTLAAPTGFEDWLPTLLDLAGLHDRIPAGGDGVSLAAALEGTAAPADRLLYRELTEGKWQAVTAGRWKAVRRAAGPQTPAQAKPTELFDLSADPTESTDVAAEHPDVVARLEAIMDREHVSHPDWPLPFADAASRRTGAKPAAALPAATATPPAAAKPAKRPNILFILADDQSPFDLKAYDPDSSLETPVIDSLAARGCVLDAAYHMGSFSGAVCTPSRHMIMTGRSVWHLPIGPGKRRCPDDIEDHVLAEVFNAAGYDTMRTCKQGNSYEGANRRFTVRHDATKRAGTAEGGSAWHAERVLDFLAAREAAGDTDPFLVYYGFSHPHDTRDGTPELLAKYGATNHTDQSRPPRLDAKQPPLSAAWLPAHPFDNTHMAVRDEVAVSGVWRRRDEATIRNELGREFACSENIDLQIGRVLDKLRGMGELDNTWIIYTADHGMAIGRHGLQGKQNLYEHTWRVPLIVAGPGVKAGSRAPGNVYLADVLATLCDIAGVETPASNEGTSFLPVLTGEQRAIRELLYGAYSGGAQPGIRSVRQGDWKLIKYESPAGGLVTQLFNLRENPEEFLREHHDPAVTALSHARPAPHQKNLAAEPAHADKRRELEALLLAEMQRHDDPYRFSDQPAMETAR